MKRFTQLFTELDETNKTAEKVEAIERYFRQAPPPDAAWGLFFLSGQRLKRVAKTSVVQSAALKASGMPAWMLGECYEAVGDLSETISLLLPDPAGTLDEPLHEVIERRVRPLVMADDRLAEAMLREAWAPMDRAQRFVFSKLVRGNFRVGVQRALVVRALAAASGVEAAVLAHRVSGGFEASEAAYAALIGPGGAADDATRPYPFCLAHQLDVPLAELGERGDWRVEFKWDGIRAQVLRREAIPGGVALWSRGEEPIAGQFPEVAEAGRRLPPGTVLDGEILAWRFDGKGGGAGGRPLSFNALQTRLGRKDAQSGLFGAEGVAFAAFDVLEHRGEDLRARPLRQRLEVLLPLLAEAQAASDGLVRLPPQVNAATWEEVEAVRAGARDLHGAEGVMLKHLGSRYHVGRIAGGTGASTGQDDGLGAGWWKWKANPYSVDAVLLYAQQGSGRRAGLFTDYTFGVWDPDQAGELVPFAKAYSGLTNDEIRAVDRFIRGNTTGRTGPVRIVRPQQVFEISFEGVQESTRHRSGVAVRFPRITRWRTDKPAAEADTIQSVRALLAAARARDAR